MVGLGFLPGGAIRGSGATDVSADGSVVVGLGDSASGIEAFRWTVNGGMVGLGDLPGGLFRSVAQAVSADGSVVVGYGSSSSGNSEAFRWTSNDRIVGLGDLPGGIFYSEATGTSADGSVVVGNSVSSSGGEAFIWKQDEGMRSLRDVLVTDYALGSVLNGWRLVASDISPDGATIVGSGINPLGQAEAWIARIPPQLDIAMQSAQLQGGNTVQFTYETTGNPGPFQVGLYRSTDGITFNPADLIATQPVTPPPSGEQGSGTFTLPNPWTPDPSKPYLIVVADPNDLISESVPNNNSQSIALPDIVATFLAWNVAAGSVNGSDFVYQVRDANLPLDTTITLYWASGGTLLQKAFEIPAEKPIGTYSNHVTLSSLTPAPTGTNRLVFVADPANVGLPTGNIPEVSEDNNVRTVSLYALKDSSVIVTDQITSKVDQLASAFYLATGKIFVVTDGFRTPAQQAAQILNTIKNEGIVETRRLYSAGGDGGTINEILRAYDSNKSDAENLTGMTNVIIDQLTRRNNRRVISSHLLGLAIDVSVDGLTPQDIATLNQLTNSIPGAIFKDETWRAVGPHIHLSFL